jgi:hypothetical protein
MVEKFVDQTEQTASNVITYGLSGFTLTAIGCEIVSRELLWIPHDFSTVIA